MSYRNLGNIDEKIIEATFHVAGNAEPHRFSTKKIAEICGISEFVIYHHFKNRENLIAETDKYLADRWYEILTNDIDKGASFETLINDYFDYFAIHPDYVLFSLNYCRAFAQAQLPADFEDFRGKCNGVLLEISSKRPVKEEVNLFNAWCDFAREINLNSYYLSLPGNDTPANRKIITDFLTSGYQSLLKD